MNQLKQDLQQLCEDLNINNEFITSDAAIEFCPFDVMKAAKESIINGWSPTHAIIVFGYVEYKTRQLVKRLRKASVRPNKRWFIKSIMIQHLSNYANCHTSN